ncbi:hypothetical protein [Gemmobacter sp.]|uniref:hypothetical protein n=1 Tax=Gemmobacter sp. TaxID=1898957 RepID=UPI00391AF9E0
MARVIQLITEFRTCDLPNVLALGGPGHATGVPSRFADRRAFPGLSRNEGPAASWVLLMIVLALPVAFLWLPGRRDGGSPGQANPIQRNLAKVGRQAHPLRSSPAPVPGQS